MDKPIGPRRTGVIVGIAFGAVFGSIVILTCIFFCLRYLISRKGRTSSNEENMRSCSLPIRTHGENTSMDLSDRMPHHQHLQPYTLVLGPFSFWGRSMEDRPRLSTQDRIIQFTYKELQKATNNFTMVIGKGAFGPVYKAMLPNTAVAAVKVLSNNSKQGEKEFQNEVMLLGRLHHRNLLNLMGYCVDRGHRILAYDYMSNRSLDLRLHDERYQVLSWGQRISIAQDVARGIEYLHDGVCEQGRVLQSIMLCLILTMGVKVMAGCATSNPS